MKNIRLILALFVVSLFVIGDSDAAMTIRQMQYTYDYNRITREKGNALQFVFCSTCAAPPSLSERQTPVELPVTVRLSGENNKVLSKPLTPEQIPQREVSILFDLNSSIIRETEKTQLLTFAMNVKQELSKQTSTVVTVEGYTCDIGTKKHNDLLARERANNVASYLKTTGVYPSSVTGQGKCCYATDDPNAKHLNRRVKVQLTEKGRD